MTPQHYLKILTEKEKREIIQKLNKQFGIKEVPGIITMHGKEKLFLFQGDLNENEIKELEQNIPIEKVGIYFAKLIGNEVKLSIDGVQVLKDQITKNILEINEKQAEQWMMGRELLFDDVFENKSEKTNKLNEIDRTDLENYDINNKLISEQSEPENGADGWRNENNLNKNSKDKINNEKADKKYFSVKNINKSDEQSEEQIRGWRDGKSEFTNKKPRGFVIIKFKDDFLGTGKASENKITNFIPKNRRLKEKS